MSAAANANGRPVRILISGSLATGGVQTHLLSLCRALRDAGADVTLAAAGNDWPSGDVDIVRDTGCRIVTTRFSSRSLLGKLQAFATWPFILGRDFDVLYCLGYGRMHGWMKRFLAPGGFSIYHEIVESPPTEDFVSVRSARLMDGVITSSDLIGKTFARFVPDKPIRAIQAFSAGIPAAPAPRPTVADRELRVAYLGRVARHKQTDWLVKEWQTLSAAAPLAPARLDVFGNDEPTHPLLAELRAFLELQGPSCRVTLHGEYHHSQLPAILANVDVVVLPSLWDAVPIVLIEAMQCGVPVVAMATGGIGELAVDNPDVEITPARDNAAFAAGLQRMAAKLRSGAIDPQRLHAWVEARYSYAVLGPKWVEALTHPRDFFGLLDAPDPADRLDVVRPDAGR